MKKHQIDLNSKVKVSTEITLEALLKETYVYGYRGVSNYFANEVINRLLDELWKDDKFIDKLRILAKEIIQQELMGKLSDRIVDRLFKLKD